jgi:DNA-binding CsgD family transcriptional regulator
MPKDTDSVIFSETEREILELALQNPELSNAEIADQTGMRITLVRDTRAQYEDDVELAEGVAESDSGSADDGESVTVDGAELSETQQAILETAAEDPTMMNADIAAETGARIALVRDTLDQYGDAVDTAAGSDDSEDDETEVTDTVSEPNDTQAAILDLASENPEMTNAEIADQTGARITLVRDTLEEFDGTSGTVGTDTDASESAAVEANGFSDVQLEILETALENPDLTNGEIANQTGTRITLVRDTIADYQSDDEASTVTDSESDSGSDEIPSEIDTDEFSETQIEILQTALANPELTNGEIADKTGTRLTLVRDTIHEHEYDQKPWDKDLDEEPDDDSEDDETDAETTSTTEEIEMPETTASDLLSDREREILETALENPALTNGEIADQTGARLTLVRDTRATYEEAVDLAEDSEEPDDTGGSQTATASEPTAKQREILDAVEANPDQTNGEIADQTGARLTLVRDTRAQYEDAVDLSGDESVDTETAAASGESADADASDATADQANNGGKVVAALVVVLLLLGLAAAAGII